LIRAAKATVQRILAEQPLHPSGSATIWKSAIRIRGPDEDVLLVYQEVALQNEASRAGQQRPTIITVSVDEKPGLQAIANTAPDLPPVPGKHPGVGRDHEYKRLGTCSILAALDLHEGHVIARVERRHRSREFIALLKDLDQHYPPTAPSESSWTTIPRTSPKRREHSWLPAQPLPVRSDAEARIVAKYRGDPFWQDGAHISPAYPGAILGGTPRADPAGNLRNQCRPGSSSLEEIRRFGFG